MEDSNKIFDLIIVGAGTGGATAAKFASKKGLEVCLIDRKERTQIGNKICGDAVGKEVFDFLDIKPPEGEELSCHIKGAKLYAPNREKCLTLIDPKQAGYIVDRLKFGQRLLDEALDAEVNQFLDNTMALDLLYNNQYVSGLKVRLPNGEKTDLKAKMVIDASGFHSPIRKKIVSDIIEKEIPKEDYMLCYREIIKLSGNDQQVIDPEYISITLDQESAPGGYIWYFPKDETSVNIGIGVYPEYKGKVKDFYQKNVYNEYIKTSGVKIISSGGGVVSVRRPLWSCADNGIMFVGDSACQVNPLHGGGIDPSMRAGFFAAETAKDAIDAEDYSIDKLWDYNYKVMTSFGAEFASLDLLRIVLQNLSNADLNFGLSKDLLTSGEILEISSKGRVKISLLDMAVKAVKGLFRPNLLLDLNFLRIKMNDISLLYERFPNELTKFGNWKNRVIEIYDRIKKSIVNPKKGKN